jgi:ribosomal protein S8
MEIDMFNKIEKKKERIWADERTNRLRACEGGTGIAIVSPRRAP